MKYIPHDYQRYCIVRIIRQNNLGLFLDMGLGKTVITLSAFYTLKFRGEIKNCLVIAPKKVAENVWRQEAEKWEHLQNLTFSIVLGSAKKRIEALNKEADVYVINRENTEWLCEQFQKQKMPFDMLVIDELSSFKSPSSKRFRSLAKRRNEFKRIVGLTGTPSPNGLIDLWSQIYLLDGGLALGSKVTHYRDVYFRQRMMPNYSVKYTIKDEFAKQEIQKKIKPLCVSMSAEDYLKMPQMLFNKISVELSEEEMKQYKFMEENYILSFENGEVVTATSAGVLTCKLLQLSSGAIYNVDKEPQQFHTQKIEVLKETIEQLVNSGENVLLFYIFKHEKDRILEALKSYKIRVLQDDKDVKDWNNKDIQILLAQPQSTAYGLNLQQGGHHIIWYSLTWNLEHYQQANARLYRQGQDKPVMIHHLITKDTIDEIVYLALRKKENVQHWLLNSLKLQKGA